MFILHSLPCISGWNLIQHEMALSLIRKPGHILCLPAPSSVCLALWKCYGASTMAQQVKNPPAMQEMQVQSLNGEDPLDKEMATHSSILAWEFSWTEEPGVLQCMRSQRVRHDLATKKQHRKDTIDRNRWHQGWITINCGKFWKGWEYQTTWSASWETYMQVRKQQLELDMEQLTGSK